MPVEWTGTTGEIADGLNDVIIAYQTMEDALGRGVAHHRGRRAAGGGPAELVDGAMSETALCQETYEQFRVEMTAGPPIGVGSAPYEMIGNP